MINRIARSPIGRMAGAAARAVRRTTLFIAAPENVFEFPPGYQFVLNETYARQFAEASETPWHVVKPMVGKWTYFVHIGNEDRIILLYEVE